MKTAKKVLRCCRTVTAQNRLIVSLWRYSCGFLPWSGVGKAGLSPAISGLNIFTLLHRSSNCIRGTDGVLQSAQADRENCACSVTLHSRYWWGGKKKTWKAMLLFYFCFKMVNILLIIQLLKEKSDLKRY